MKICTIKEKGKTTLGSLCVRIILVSFFFAASTSLGLPYQTNRSALAPESAFEGLTDPSSNIKFWSEIESKLVAFVDDAKRRGLSNNHIKVGIETILNENIPNIKVQWHLIEHGKERDNFLFTVNGKRLYVGFDISQRKATTEFTRLYELLEWLQFIVQSAGGNSAVASMPGKSWENILAKISLLYDENSDLLADKNRGDVKELLEYVLDMDYSNGYLDEIRILIKRIDERKDVPAIFSEGRTGKPLGDKEFVVMQTILTPERENRQRKILEISAIRYKGMKVVGKFHTFVRCEGDDERTLEDARDKDIQPSALTGSGVPDQEGALNALRAFIGNTTIVTHLGMGKIKELNGIAGSRPISNPVEKTQALINKLLPELSVRERRIPSLFERLGVETPEKPIRGFRLLRLYRILVEELALLAMKKVDSKGESWEYVRFLADLTPPDKSALLKKYELLDTEYPGKFMHAKSWKEVSGIIKYLKPGDVEVLVLDFDNTIAGSKGWIGSDDWFKWEMQFKAQYGGRFIPLLERFNKMLTKMGFFKPKEKIVLDVINAAKAKGIKVMVLTARQDWPDRPGEHPALLKKALDNMGIEIDVDDVVLTGDDEGHADKPSGLMRYCMEKYGRVPKMMFMDDSMSHLSAVAENPELEEGMEKFIWYDTKIAHHREFNHKYQLEQARKLLEEDPSSDEIIGYLLNAFGLANSHAPRRNVIEVIEYIREALNDYRGEPEFSDVLREYITFSINQDPTLKRALLLNMIRQYKPVSNVYFKDLFENAREKWGEIDFDINDGVFLVQDSQLARERSMAPLLDSDNRISGVRILTHLEPEVSLAWWEKDMKTADALRLPTVSRERIHGRSLSFDKKIQKAEDRAAKEGRSLKLDRDALAFISGSYKALLIDKEILARFLNKLAVISLNLHKEYPDLVDGKPVGRDQLMRLFLKAIDLLNDAEAPLEIRLVPPEPGDKGPSLWGFKPDRGETVTDEGLDASNLPFLVRRIGNKLYMKEVFFNEFSGKDPTVSTIFWEALFHELAEDPRIAKTLGLPEGREHNFASMMTELVRSAQQLEYERLHDDKHMHQWLLRFYKPQQLASFLNYHTGLQAGDWRFRAYLELYNRKRADLIVEKIIEIIKKDEVDNHEELEDDGVFLARVMQMYDGSNDVINKIFNNLSVELLSKINDEKRRHIEIDTSIPMMANMRRMINEGHIGEKTIEEYLDDPKERIYVRNLYSYVKTAALIPTLEDRMKAFAGALKEGLLHIDASRPENIVVWNLSQLIDFIYMNVQIFPTPSLISAEFENKLDSMVKSVNNLNIALSRYEDMFINDPYELKIADLLMKSGGHPSVLLMLLRDFISDIDRLIELIDGVNRAGQINNAVGGIDVISHAA